jgi:hypothetical protein
MKRILLTGLVITCMFSFSAIAQITITNNDFPVIGNLVVRAVDEVTTVSPGNAGTNQIWDFSNLVITRYDSAVYIPPQGVTGYENYPDANMVAKHYNGPQEYNHSYNFLKSSTGGLQWIGDENFVTLFGTFSLNMHTSYHPAPFGLPLPFSFGNTSSQDFEMDWYMATRNAGDLLDSTKKISHMNLTMTADASGTMITPGGSFPVLRVKELISTTDSSYTYTSGSWVLQSDTTYSWTQYRWYTNDYGEVGYYYARDGKGNGFSYFKSETIVGINDVKDKPGVTIYPNPSQSLISIDTKERINKVEIYNTEGNLKMVVGNSGTIDITSLSSGLYIARVYTLHGRASASFLKK